jgi:RNA polymerase sigma factor (sigma-70 family)
MFERAEVIKQFSRLLHKLSRLFDSSGRFRADLYQEGCCGLLEAHDRFDSSRGTQFLTYAYPWVYARMQQYCEVFELPVKISHNAQTQMRRNKKDVDASAGVGIVGVEFLDVHGRTDRVRDVFADVIVQEACMALPAKLQYVLFRHVIEEETLETVANEIGCSRQYAHKLYMSAIDQLRRVIIKRQIQI